MKMSDICKDMHFDEALVFQHIKAKDTMDALEQMAMMLYREGIVKKSYIDAVMKREKEYPTGLACQDMGVAIPHTDAQHVLVQAIGIGILDTPVRFHAMGTMDQGVEVKVIFMMAIKEPHKQVDFLQALMMAFMEQGKLNRIVKASSKKEIVETFTSFFNKGEEL